MSNHQKFARSAPVAGLALAATLAAAPASAQQMSIGAGATLNLSGEVNSQVALALGNGASASNNVAGVLAMGALTSR
jgi:hypothetical protein